MAHPLLPAPSTAATDLPVRSALPELITAVAARGCALLVAPPGSGKTSLLPLALADAVPGRVIVAEPRRIATRAAAVRLAMLLGEQPGDRIGYAMRGERAGGSRSRVEVVTTGLLVQRLQRDPELAGVGTVIIDECHERHLDADLALAFCLDVRANLRADLALVATSATPDSGRLAAVLAGGGAPAPVVTATAARFDVEIVWAPPARGLPLLADARVDPALLDHVGAVVRRALAEAEGDVLVFLPGEAEIAAVSRRLHGSADIVALFGRQSGAEQEHALTPGRCRRVVLSTAVAESSLTVPGVRIVVDAGLARQPRTDYARGLGALVTTRVSKSSADQRAGRAGRQAPGRVYRCWSPAEHAHLEEHPAPEIATADLAGLALAVAAWGAPGGTGLGLLDQPPAAAMAAAQLLLRSLDAIGEDGRITGRGRRIAGVAAHPRLARALIDGAPAVGGGRSREIVALLSDSSLAGPGDDLPGRLRQLRRGQDPAAAARWREEVRRLHDGSPSAADTAGTADADSAAGARLPDDLAVATMVGLAYPDRLARARRPGSASYLMAGGTGAALRPGSGLLGTEWLAIAVADRPVGRADARIRAAAPVDAATARSVAAGLLRVSDEAGWSGGELVLRRRELLGAITLTESPLPDPAPGLVAAAVRDGVRASGLGILHWTGDAEQLRQRLAFCAANLGAPWPAVDDEALFEQFDRWLAPSLTGVRRTRDLARVDAGAALRRLLPWPAAARLDELAPPRLQLPSGSWVRLSYDGSGPPTLAVAVQQVFGWLRSPSVAEGRVPVLVQLLSPAGRPVATTADLASFWRQGYPQVRAELRGRYPRHSWPEDPVAAAPASRPAPRRG